jgi:hypothetical protein
MSKKSIKKAAQAVVAAIAAARKNAGISKILSTDIVGGTLRNFKIQLKGSTLVYASGPVGSDDAADYEVYMDENMETAELLEQNIGGARKLVQQRLTDSKTRREREMLERKAARAAKLEAAAAPAEKPRRKRNKKVDGDAPSKPAKRELSMDPKAVARREKRAAKRENTQSAQ